MPDRHGFNHLGQTVRCIDCPTGGPIWQWPGHKRHRHALTHNTKENPTMPARKPTTNFKNEPAKNVAIDVMRKAGEPLHVKEITKRVLASGRCTGLKGKTPDATIAAMLAVGSKPGGPFTRTDKATYTLTADSATMG